jgi:hypothetical protein
LFYVGMFSACVKPPVWRLSSRYVPQWQTG